MVASNTDPDTGSFDAEGDGTAGGSTSAEHYPRRATDMGTRPYTHYVVDSTDCRYCHANSANGSAWGGARQISGEEEHNPDWTSAQCRGCHGDVANTDFHDAVLRKPED
jgi:hypothetical protein